MESRHDQLIANVSHELRTPLHAMLGWAQMLLAHERVVGDEQLTRGLQIIVRNAKLQGRLIDDLLDASSLLSGTLRLQLAPLSVELAVREALESFASLAQTKALQLRSQVEPDTGYMSADNERMQQVLANLLANALKFSPRGGAIDVRARRQDGRIWIEVEDDGPGIDAELMPFVFERYRRGNAADQAGLGLGLAIAHGLIALHGGTIEATRRARGALFAISVPSLPAVAQGGSDSQPPPPLSSITSERLLAGVRVAIVDAEVDAVELLGVVLGHAGAEVHAYASAQAMLSSSAPVDVLVLDIRMDDGAGVDLLAALRRRGINAPAVALTGRASPRDRLLALQAGFRMHVSKPVDGHELLVTIASVLGRFLPAAR